MQQKLGEKSPMVFFSLRHHYSKMAPLRIEVIGENQPSEQSIEEIHSLLKENRPFLLAVFASWCSHCVTVKKAHWPNFKASKEGKQIPIVELDYAAYSSIAKSKQFKDCLFAKIMQKSVRSFPFVALVKNSPSEVNVRVYEEYPMDAQKLSAFAAM
jgi:thiol-disulfide isomerase/thioredoxin